LVKPLTRGFGAGKPILRILLFLSLF
jgi:hypothetical protein